MIPLRLIVIFFLVFAAALLATQTIQAANTAPFITGIVNQTQGSSAVIGPLSFSIADAETAASALTVTAASSNTTLLPSAGLLLDGTGANRTLTITPAVDQLGTAILTLTVSDGTLTGSLRFTVTINNGATVSGNAPPVIGGIPNQIVALNQKMGPVNFVVADAVTSNSTLPVTAVSSNPALTATIQLGGTASSRTITITPASGQTGTATLTLTTTDGGGLTASTAFILTVTAANTLPTLSALPNQSLALGATPPALSFTIADAETAADRLWITARSSNQTLLPDAGLALGGSGNTRTLSCAPASGQTGVATLTLTVTDGGGMSVTGQTLFIVRDLGTPGEQFLRPQGIYSLDSALGGTYNGYSLRDANLRDYPFVDGYVLHAAWNQLETSPGVYDFFLIQNTLSKLPAGQTLSLIITPAEPPDIATTSGVATWIDSSGGTPLTRAVPWDPTLRLRRDTFLHALASASIHGLIFRDNPQLAILNPFLPGGGGGLRDPSPAQPLSSLPGYTRAKLLGAVQDELRTLSSEFPLHYIQLGFWPILDNENASYSGTPAWDWLRQQLLAEFNGLTRPHLGFFMDNLAANRAAPGQDPATGFPNTTFAAPMYNSRTAAFNGFEALGPWIQPFKSGTTNSIALNTLNGTPADGLETGYNTFGAAYVEIYAADLDVAAFQPLLQHWHDLYRGIAPNPASDEDGDGLPLAWEQATGLNPRLGTGSDGAVGDPDGDGQNNAQEYLTGTQPLDPASRFAITAAAGQADGSFSATFPAVAGHSYSVKYTADLITWSKLLDINATLTGPAPFTDPAPGVPRRFYRVVTPAEP
ncbi:MAG: hypothetical protein ABIT76_07855 [Chthoniobacterales bacterium]